jgi:hypothetical protein
MSLQCHICSFSCKIIYKIVHDSSTQVQLLIFSYLNEDSSNFATFQAGYPTGKLQVNLS